MSNFNIYKQHTIAKEVNIQGKGLHTGVEVNMKLLPACSGHGIQFRRIDLPNMPLIKADCDLVVDTSRGTTLAEGNAKVSTVEHILAALTGTGVDNVLVELNGPEIPIMDGSSQIFVELIEEAKVIEQDSTKIWYSIDENIFLYNDEKRVEMVAMPSMNYQITTLIDFNSPVLGTQHAGLKDMVDFNKEIAPCRTFCFLHELETLIEYGLIKGGDVNNAIIVVDKLVSEVERNKLAKLFKKDNIAVLSEGYLNNLELRFPNEPARHKLLDVIGDLTLIGYPIHARIIANRPGHSTNIEFAKKIKQYIKKNKHAKNVPIYNSLLPPVYSLDVIEKVLPHRYPFLLVDKIIELSDTHIVGVKNVSFNEWFFQGHFPGNPIMPGVLQIEALAQTGGLLCINNIRTPEDKDAVYDTYFLKIDNCKFKRKIIPGDTMLLKLELANPSMSNILRRGICEMHGTVFVNGKVATEAELTAKIIKRENNIKADV